MKDCTDIKILRDHRRPRGGGGGIRGQTSLQNSLNIYIIKLPKICLRPPPPYPLANSNNRKTHIKKVLGPHIGDITPYRFLLL